MPRRNVLFKSNSFNTTEQKEYFINPGCFGDDLARWLTQRLRDRGIPTEAEPGQEDFGWYLRFRIAETEHNLVIVFRPDDIGSSGKGDWLCVLERRAGFAASLFGGRKKGITAEAPRILHEILQAAPEISEIRWFSNEEGEDSAQPQP